LIEGIAEEAAKAECIILSGEIGDVAELMLMKQQTIWNRPTFMLNKSAA